MGKILNHVGLLTHAGEEDLRQTVSRLLADQHGKFHFASLIRCTVERRDAGLWKGSGGMLDKFVATPFGREISSNCTTQFLQTLPAKTKLIVMFGMGSKLNYVREAFALYQSARGGTCRWINEVAYTDGKVTVVHVEHFASQGSLIPRWLGNKTTREPSTDGLQLGQLLVPLSNSCPFPTKKRLLTPGSTSFHLARRVTTADFSSSLCPLSNPKFYYGPGRKWAH